MTDTNTEDKPTLDLAQRIAAALARTDEARPNPSTMERRENDIELGIVPLHLRHLHNLLVECERGEHEVLHRLFFQALDEHLTATDVQLHKKKLLPDWTILDVPDDGRSSSGMPDGLVMLHIGGLSDGREEGGGCSTSSSAAVGGVAAGTDRPLGDQKGSRCGNTSRLIFYIKV